MAEPTHSTAEPLGRYVERTWSSNPAAQTRRGRAAGRYHAFVPDPIAEHDFPFETGASVALHEATKALERLQHVPSRVATLDAVAKNLLRSESVASSRIEGVLISHKRLARAAHLGTERQRRDRPATEVLGNVDAMRRAIETGAGPGIAVADLVEIHRLLLRRADERRIAGVVRSGQNWIGGNTYDPLGAAFVPPPPEHVPELLEDLCRFVERDDLPPIVQAAIAHAQFETIHPFADGNGRTGRALIYAVLRRRGEVTRYIAPVSLMLAATPAVYIGGLSTYREGGVSEWCELFAALTARAAREAERLAGEIEGLAAEWLARAGKPREGSTARLLIAALPEQPVLDSATAQRMTGRSHVAVNNALRRLAEAGVLRPLNERKWGRAWECDELLDLVEDFEASIVTGGRSSEGGHPNAAFDLRDHSSRLQPGDRTLVNDMAADGGDDR